MPPPRFTPKRPQGQVTRGKTASNRLRRVDNFILLYEPSLLTRTDGLFADSIFVDLGYGFDARTTLESASRFRRLNPDLKILGVEIDKERVDNALPFADEKTFFRLGGFNLPLKEGEHVRLIRAFNVLRQYEEEDFAPACERMAQHVLTGGNDRGDVHALRADLGREPGTQAGKWTVEHGSAGLQYTLSSEV